MNNKRAMSAIVITVIMVALVLVAIGIVWAVISNILEERGGQIITGGKCLDVTVKATDILCTSTTCDVTYSRNAGGEEIGGIKIILSDGISSIEKDIEANIPELATVTQKAIDYSTKLSNMPNSVEIAVYFIGADNKKSLCSNTNTLTGDFS